MFNLNRNLARMRKRNGISIIEVLTSMAVATIGVFGIMVMIPFAVKQSQLGLDSDAAHNLGRNALEEMQISGLFQVGDDGDFDRLVVLAAADGAALFPHPLPGVRGVQRLSTEDLDTNHRAPGIFHLDPIGFAAGLDSFEITEFPAVPDPGAPIEILSASVARNSDIDLNVDGVADFDNAAPNDLPSRFRLDNASITALTRSQIPFTAIEANRLFRSNDDLFFQNESTGVEVYAPPQPLYNIDSAGNRVRRQTGGRISWSAFLVPEKDSLLPGAPATQFRANVLVYSDRFLAPPDPANPNATVDSNYGFYLVDTSTAPGYVESVSQVPMDINSLIPADTIFRGDWVMLVNRIAEADGASTREWPAFSNNFHRSADEGHRLQIMFAKVSRVSPDGTSISIDGGSFDFVVDGVPSPSGGAVPPPSSRTYMVHLKNVVNVFERSISIE